MIDRCKAIGGALGLTVATYGHAGDGNLHANILFESVEERPKVDEALRQMAVVAIELGGTITGEHGIGTLKAPWLEQELGSAELARQRAIKALFDPRGILNPGRVYRA
jgi:glycolate oxidase